MAYNDIYFLKSVQDGRNTHYIIIDRAGSEDFEARFKNQIFEAPKFVAPFLMFAFSILFTESYILSHSFEWNNGCR
jgi:hypothetical protein